MLCDSRFEQAIARVRGPALLLGVLGLVLNVLWQSNTIPALATIPEWLGEVARKSLVAWLFIVGLLGYARAHLAERPRDRRALAFLAYFGEASYPFYILHQTVIVALGFYLAQWTAGPAVKYLVLGSLTYLITIGLYDLAIRRSNLTRFLFGMKPRPRS
jgi:peptidoglycan/LPS O-acetylase OafA/YrhL